MLNSLLIEGRIFGEVEALQTPKGIPVALFSVASDRFENQEKHAIVVDVEAYGKLAANLEGLKDGTAIRIAGRLAYKWGDAGKRVVVIAEHVEFKPI
jgi:single-stranded DNA-binding protein